MLCYLEKADPASNDSFRVPEARSSPLMIAHPSRKASSLPADRSSVMSLPHPLSQALTEQKACFPSGSQHEPGAQRLDMAHFPSSWQTRIFSGGMQRYEPVLSHDP